jgi:hypothetical protein
LKLLLAGRDENPTPDLARARAQAAELFEAIKKGKSMLGGLSSDTEKKITDVLTNASPAQCRAIKVGRLLPSSSSHHLQDAWEVANPSSPSLDATIEAKIGGALRTALVYLLKDPIDLYCMKIKTACSGLTCDEEPLSRILGGEPLPLSPSLCPC